MSSSAKDFEDFAKDCVRLADQADTPTLRERLLDLARIWNRLPSTKKRSLIATALAS